MGVIKQGILGGFKGKVGSVIGTSWKGKAVMKSMPLSVANPRTAGQVLQRNKFKTIVELASGILASIVKPLWDRFASGMSGYNAFVSANCDAVLPNSSLDYNKLVIAKGKMLAPVNVTRVLSGTTCTFGVTHPVGDRFALPTDNIFVLAYSDADSKVIFAGQAVGQRGSSAGASATFTVPVGTVDTDIEIGSVAYLRADGSEVSNSKTVIF